MMAAIEVGSVIACAIIGWTLVINQPVGTQLGAAVGGAVIGFIVGLIAMRFVAIALMKRNPQTGVTIEKEVDWRERSRRINERTLRNFKWLRKRAWIFALLYALVATAGYIAMEESFYLLLSFPFNFFAMYLVVRLAAWFGIKTSF